MLSLSVQEALARVYGGGSVRPAFNGSVGQFGGLGALPGFAGDHEVEAAAIYVDIAEFAEKVAGMPAYLDVKSEAVMTLVQ